MEKEKIIYKTVTLAYFSGTGGTKMVADCFFDQFTELGIIAKKINIGKSVPYEPKSSDLLLIFSPVYAFRLSSIVEKWVSNLPKTLGKSVALFSVSGAGEISPNTACRTYCKNILRKKGYDFIYEKMLIMPSNIAIQAEEQMNFDLLNVLPLKTKQIIKDIQSGNKNITRPLLQDRFLPFLGRGEHLGARFFGASIHASNACNHCGLCIQNCPQKNIHMNNNTPKFGFRCVWCLKCIYACPYNALSPRLAKFTIFKDGYNIYKLKKLASQNSKEITYNSTRNFLWQGVIDYLNESSTKL